MTEACGRVSGVPAFLLGVDQPMPHGSGFSSSTAGRLPMALTCRSVPPMAAFRSASAEVAKEALPDRKRLSAAGARDPWAANDVGVFCWQRHVDNVARDDSITRQTDSLLSSGAEGWTIAPAVAHGGESVRSIAEEISRQPCVELGLIRVWPRMRQAMPRLLQIVSALSYSRCGMAAENLYRGPCHRITF